jgi:hypothetical protein
MANEVQVKEMVSWTYPLFGNKHTIPYGVLLVTDGVTEKACRTKGDREDDGWDGPQYITFKRKRYEVVREGRPFAEKFSLKPLKSNRRSVNC